MTEAPSLGFIRRAMPLLVLPLAGCVISETQVEFGARPAAAELRAFIRHEMQHKAIPALSIALVEGQRVILAEGFGQDPRSGAAATGCMRVAS